ncbi:IS4/Tn5 family transposase DNA-binding protein [Verminephrobacter aporrectodeae]|uniref:IS4/Tn5 family transposase DNA-binding protein n=1 Tax=Verminephrobacter aporrectodeae TaxID=1110389 RepID=UPI00389A48CE
MTRADQRLSKRTVSLVERLRVNPLASIPQACGRWAQTRAAYAGRHQLVWGIRAPH